MTLVAQAERRLRDAALELGPYGAERQQRAVEMCVRDVQDLLAQDDLQELELAVSGLQKPCSVSTGVSPLNARLKLTVQGLKAPWHLEG